MTRASLEQRLVADGCNHRVSMMTYLVQWTRAPCNLGTILAFDRDHFKKSKFTSSAYEFRPFSSSDARRSIRMRLYPSSHKVLVTGVTAQEDCSAACDALSRCLGDLEFDPPECQLININIALPHSLGDIRHSPGIRFVERQEGHPAVIVHVATSRRIRKVLVYPKSGKISLHVASFDEATEIWDILQPSLTRGFPIQL
ncbi:MAG: hypothetical protein ACO35C_04385 [Pontimonas sp.]